MNGPTPTYQWDKTLAPFVREAFVYYYDEYHNGRSSAKKKYIASLKYFPLLEEIYKGKTHYELSERTGLSNTGIRDGCFSVQGKVVVYLKLKELGRL